MEPIADYFPVHLTADTFSAFWGMRKKFWQTKSTCHFRHVQKNDIEFYGEFLKLLCNMTLGYCSLGLPAEQYPKVGFNSRRRSLYSSNHSGSDSKSTRSFLRRTLYPLQFLIYTVFYTFAQLNIYGFSTLFLRFLRTVLAPAETRKALGIQHGDVSKWS